LPTANAWRFRPRRSLEAADPTGCGDAFRAGVLYGLENGLDWETTGRSRIAAGRDQDRSIMARSSITSRSIEFKDRYRYGVRTRLVTWRLTGSLAPLTLSVLLLLTGCAAP
jgi:hypothetical protein